ncbi:MAG TPA: formate/nitrite transporter family protein [Pirellulales bacterium]|nr:formate/nitrite transporter family protein [Pirellulales bacterium]
MVKQPVVTELPPKKSPGAILSDEVKEGVDALERSSSGLFVSGVSAGLELGLSLLLIAIVRTKSDGSLPPTLDALLLASMYSFGFIVVVLGRSELFTEQTTLAILPLRAGRTTFKKVARLWGLVYAGNLLGAAICPALFVLIAPALHIAERETFVRIASEVLAFPAWVFVLSGVLAGWLMGLVSWGVAAARDSIGQIVTIWMITSVIGLGHLHHSVLGFAEVVGGVYAGGDFAWGELVGFQCCTTLGNAVGGGCFVALLKHGHAGAQTPA